MEALGGRRGLLVVDRKLESRAKAGIQNGLQAHFERLNVRCSYECHDIDQPA